MDHQVQPFDDGFRLFFHARADPIQQQAHKRVLIEIGDKRLVLVPYGDFRRLFLQHAVEQAVGLFVKIAL